jgi:hypothetical protein
VGTGFERGGGIVSHTRPPPGAPAALRGYRLQAQYTLFRLLGEDGISSVQAEQHEDLTITFADGAADEVVQVKAHSDPLTPSTLGRYDDGGYFRRVLLRRQWRRPPAERVASFGPLGQELEAAWQGEGPSRLAVSAKLTRAGYTEPDVEALFESVRFLPLVEDAVLASVLDRIRATAAGVDVEAAFALLHSWLFVASERREVITPERLAAKLQAVGAFLHGRTLHHSEWFTTIRPVELPEAGLDRDKLRTEFGEGTSARYDHIVAGVDVRRTRLLDAIDAALSASRVVVLHGASGQGKTSLALRYLHDCVPAGCRYQVRGLESGGHARGVGKALLDHLRALDCIACVNIDVEPGDEGWLELVRDLAEYPLVRVLVTIREEDWNRTPAPRRGLPMQDIALELSAEDAREVFDQLLVDFRPNHVVDFDDAWARFGSSGPLLEFCYFVRRNAFLPAVLAGQVERLEGEVLAGELPPAALALLRMTAVVTGSGARLQLAKAVACAGLDRMEAKAVLHLFEREFLVRQAADGRTLEAVHPIRSAKLSELLLDPELASWRETVDGCLEAVEPAGLYAFLLHGLARQTADGDGLRDRLLDWRPSTWTARASVLRALIWNGLRAELDVGEPPIRDIQSKFPSGWSLLLGLDPGRLSLVSPGLAAARLDRCIGLLPEVQAELDALRERLRPVDHITVELGPWIASLDPTAAGRPATSDDWRGVAEVCFWAAQLGQKAWAEVGSPVTAFTEECQGIPLAVAAEVSYAFSSCLSADALIALESTREVLLKRLQLERGIFRIHDDGVEVTVDFLVSPTRWVDASHAPDLPGGVLPSLNFEAMSRLHLLRQITPNREFYGSKGHGHDSPSCPLPFDDTIKRIARDTLAPRWPLEVNHTFLRLADRWFRPAGWRDFAEQLLRRRTEAASSMAGLTRAIDQHFSNRRVDSAALAGIDVFLGARGWADKDVSLPRESVDPWGLISEGGHENASGTEASAIVSLPSLARYEPLRRTSLDYFQALAAFRAQVRVVSEHSIRRGRAGSVRRDSSQPEADIAAARALSTYNLERVEQGLQAAQREFRAQLSGFASVAEIEAIERSETDALCTLRDVWFEFAHHPQRVHRRVAAVGKANRKRAQRDVEDAIRSRLATLSAPRAGVVDFAGTHAGAGCLHVQMDVNSVAELADGLQAVSGALAEAVAWGEASELGAQVARGLWHNVAIAPTLRGRAFGTWGWIVPATGLAARRNAPLPWFHLVHRELPWGLVSQLPGIERIQSEPASLRALAARLQGFMTLAEVCSTTADLPEHTGVGDEVLAAYAGECSTFLTQAMTSIVAAAEELGQEIAAGRVPVAMLEIIPEAMALMTGFLDSLAESGGTMAAQGMGAFAAEVRAAAQAAVGLRFLWLEALHVSEDA